MKPFDVYACDASPYRLLTNGAENPRGARKEKFDTREEAMAFARSMYPQYDCVTVRHNGSEIARFENDRLVEGKKTTKIEDYDRGRQ